MKVFVCIYGWDYEGNSIGPIFAKEEDAKLWIDKCQQIKMEKDNYANTHDKTNWKTEEMRAIRAKFEKLDADTDADLFNYLKKTILE